MTCECQIKTKKSCGALMKITARCVSKYEVINFVTAHSEHGLVSPNKLFT